ncbi:MAG: TolC family protein [Bacteroidia bacterium]
MNAKTPYIQKLKNAFILLITLLTSAAASAQETLTLQDAIKITLENNYNIKLIKNELEIRDNNATIANAGILPQAGASLSNNNTILNTQQELQNGDIQSRNGAKNSSLQYGVFLNWTVFDGFGMFARYDQLKELEKYGEANLQLTILNRVADVVNTYYELVQQQQQLQAYDTAVAVSRFRRRIAQSRFEIGKAARLEVLNAQVDFNTDTTNLLRQQALYYNTQTQLNELMGRDINIRFRVSNDVTIDNSMTLDALQAQANKQNPALQLAQINRRIAELDLKQTRANRYPTVTLNSGYNFTDNRSALGFAVHTTGQGPYYGVTASINLFNGLQQWRNEENASLLINNAQIQYEQQKLTINSQLSAAYQNYQTNLALVELEEANQKIAFQNLDITLEKFRLGSIAPVELRDAQLNYIDATVRFSNAKYQAKLAEGQLKEIAGNMNY